MRDPFDVSLEDEELQAEVELTTSLIIAASECAQDRMPWEDIDAVLGVVASPSGSPADTIPTRIPRPRAPEPSETAALSEPPDLSS